MCSTYQTQKSKKPTCNTSPAFHNLIFIKCVKEKMEKMRHGTQRSIFGIAFKLNFSQRKPTTLQSWKKKLKLSHTWFYKNHEKTNWMARHMSHCFWEKNIMIISTLIWKTNKPTKNEQLSFEDSLENSPADVLSVLSSTTSEVVNFLICGVTSPSF